MVKAEDIKLIRAVKAGDLGAYSQLIDKYQHMVFTLANSIVKNKQEAEEVTQDALFKAYQNLEQYKEEAAFSTWLYRITYNTAISKIRVRKPETKDLESKEAIQFEMDNVHSNMNRLELQERKKILKKALSQLKEDDAFLMILYYYKEQSIEEIEKATGLSKSNIKVKLHRGRKQMQVELEKLLHDELKSFV